MRLWLDDLRPAPEGWVWYRTAIEAMVALHRLPVEQISFDHDLGQELTGYDVAKFIEGLAHAGHLDRLEWSIHSANPVGRANIERAMRSAERFWA